MATSSKSNSKKKSVTNKKSITTKKKTISKSTKKRAKRSKISASAKQKMIQEAAYFLAQQRGFAPGNETEDWLTAERQVNKRL